MKYLFLIIFSAVLSVQSANSFKKNKKFIPFNISKVNLSSDSASLYESTITGNKKHISKKLKNSLKQYGLMHLLTPSGLHLGSLFFLSLFPIFITFFVFLIILIIVQQYGSYYSLERVIIFRLIYIISHYFKLKLNIGIIFFLTLLLSIIIGNYSLSPISFLFSFMFWGTILIFKDDKIKTIIYLNLTLHLSAILFSQEVLVSSFFINPIFTFLLMIIFPLMCLNYFVGGISFINTLINIYLESYLGLFNVLSFIDPFPAIRLSIFTFLLVLILVNYKKFKWVLILLCLKVSTLSYPKELQGQKRDMINIGSPKVIKKTSNYIYFKNKKCKLRNTQISCKKKPSKMEGLYSFK